MLRLFKFFIIVVGVVVCAPAGRASPDLCVLITDNATPPNITLNCTGDISNGVWLYPNTDAFHGGATLPASYGDATINLYALTADIDAQSRDDFAFAPSLSTTGKSVTVNNQAGDASPRRTTAHNRDAFYISSNFHAVLNNNGDITLESSANQQNNDNAVYLNGLRGAALTNRATIAATGAYVTGAHLLSQSGNGEFDVFNYGTLRAIGNSSRAVSINDLRLNKNDTSKAQGVVIENYKGALIESQGDYEPARTPGAVYVVYGLPFEDILFTNAGIIRSIGQGNSAVTLGTNDEGGDHFIVRNKQGGLIEADGDYFLYNNYPHEANALYIERVGAVTMRIENGEENATQSSEIIATGRGGEAIHIERKNLTIKKPTTLINHRNGVIATLLPQGVSRDNQGVNNHPSDAIFLDAPSNKGAMTIDNAGRITAQRHGSRGIFVDVTNSDGDDLTLINRPSGVIVTQGDMEDAIASHALKIDAPMSDKNITITNQGMIRAEGTGASGIHMTATGGSGHDGLLSLTHQGVIETRGAQAGEAKAYGIFIDAAASAHPIALTQQGTIITQTVDNPHVTIKGGTGKITVNIGAGALYAFGDTTETADPILLTLENGSTDANNPNEIKVQRASHVRGSMVTNMGAEKLTIEQGGQLTLTNLDMKGGSDDVVVAGALGLLAQNYVWNSSLTINTDGTLILPLNKKAHTTLTQDNSISFATGSFITLDNSPRDFRLLLEDAMTIFESSSDFTFTDHRPRFVKAEQAADQYVVRKNDKTLEVYRHIDFSDKARDLGGRFVDTGNYLDAIIAEIVAHKITGDDATQLRSILTIIADRANDDAVYKNALERVSGAVYASLPDALYLAHQSFGHRLFSNACHLPLIDEDDVSPYVDVDESDLLELEAREPVAVGSLAPLPDSLRHAGENVDVSPVLWDVAPHRSCEWLALGGSRVNRKGTGETVGFEEEVLIGVTGGIEWRPLDESGFKIALAGNYEHLEHKVEGDGGSRTAHKAHRLQASAGVAHEWLGDNILYDAMAGVMGGWTRYDIERVLSIEDGAHSSGSFHAAGDVDVWSLGGRFGLRARYALKDWFIEPELQYDIAYVGMSSLQETGGELALNVSSLRDVFQTVEGSLNVGGRVAIGGGQLMDGHILFGFRRLLERKGDESVTVMQHVPVATGRMTNSLAIDKNMLVLGAGLSLLDSSGLIGALSYDGLVSLGAQKITRHSGRLQMYF